MPASLFAPALDLPDQQRLVRVAVERGIAKGSAIEEALTYLWPESLGQPAAGQRVLVPLGRTHVGGFIVDVGEPGQTRLLGGIPLDKTRPVAELLANASLKPHMLDLARWMSDYYVCPLGMVLSSMLPAAVKARTGAAIIAVLDWGPKAQGIESEAEHAALAGLRGPARALWTRLRALPAERLPLPPRQLAALVECTTPAQLASLVRAGLLVRSTREAIRGAPLPGAARATHATPPAAPTHEPSPDQRRVIDTVAATLGGFHVHLLRGVTGSGKTEVYLRLIARVLEHAGTGAIVLVPEIALTPQTSRRFIDRFGAQRVAVLHSGLTRSQRHAEWTRVARGEAPVVVGARSAVFAPVDRPGIIIVDEEHDGSYKQDQLPRYHGRDVAIKRAQLQACPVLLGSATPSLESWANAQSPGRSTLHELPARVGGATLPRVHLVDMREQRRVRAQQGNDKAQHLLGPALEAAVEGALASGSQVMLLLNRRGLAHYIACPRASCGFVLGCEDCSSALVLHRDRHAPAGRVVKCHHCWLEQRVPALCPTCAGPLSLLGAGTQKLEDEVERKFAVMGIRRDDTMLRLDADTMTSGKAYFAALDRFALGQARMLIGTQMIAKGLDFPGVRLVGIIDADTALALPDFRATERTFQLVSQAAGRAGRGTQAGLVLVQTYAPHLPALQHAAAHDYVAFATQELQERARAGLPPAARMARIVCRNTDLSQAQRAAAGIAHALRVHEPDVRVEGPAPCVIERIARHHRIAVDVIAPGPGPLRACLVALRRSGELTSDASTAVDVDPVALL